MVYLMKNVTSDFTEFVPPLDGLFNKNVKQAIQQWIDLNAHEKWHKLNSQ